MLLLKILVIVASSLLGVVAALFPEAIMWVTPAFVDKYVVQVLSWACFTLAAVVVFASISEKITARSVANDN
jgi:hypothetical protein